MEQRYDNLSVDVKKIIIENVDDGNGEYRENVSAYDLLTEIGVKSSEMPNYENDINTLRCTKTFCIKGFEVNIVLQCTIGTGHLCGYVVKYTGDTEWMDKDKYNSITNETFILDNVDELYKPHGGFTHTCGFDCHHFDDIGIFDEITENKINRLFKTNKLSSYGFLKNKKSFKSVKFVKHELNNIVDSLIKFLSKH